MNAATKSILICALSFSMIAPSIGQSISEKLAPKVPERPSVICVKEQCDYIYYSNNENNLLVAWIVLNGKRFYGWRPPCLSCSIEEEDYAAGKALIDKVKTQYPEVEIWYGF